MTKHKVDPVSLKAATVGGVYFFLKDVLGPSVSAPIEVLPLCCAASDERRWQYVRYV